MRRDAQTRPSSAVPLRIYSLKRNPIVRHLIDTPTHTYEASSAGFVSANTIDEVIDPIDLFAPLSADSR